jgi:hypothetical protein
LTIGPAWDVDTPSMRAIGHLLLHPLGHGSRRHDVGRPGKCDVFR